MGHGPGWPGLVQATFCRSIHGGVGLMPKIKKRIVTAEEFDDWMATCPVPYDQTDNGLNLTESYDFDLSEVKFKFEEDEED